MSERVYERIVKIGEGVRLFAINGVGRRRELFEGSPYRRTDKIVVQVQRQMKDPLITVQTTGV